MPASSQAPLSLARSWKMLETSTNSQSHRGVAIYRKAGRWGPHLHHSVHTRRQARGQSPTTKMLAPGAAAKIEGCHEGKRTIETFCWDSVQSGS